MITDRTRGVYQLTLVCQCVLVTGLFWGWFFLCHARIPRSGGTEGLYLAYNQFLVLGLLIGGSLAQRTSSFVRPSFDVASRFAFRQLGTALFYLFVFLIAVRDRSISRVFLFTFIPLMYCTLFLSSRYLPALLSTSLFRSERHERLLLVGPAAKVPLMRRWLANKRELGLDIVGLLTDEVDGREGGDSAGVWARGDGPSAPNHAGVACATDLAPVIGKLADLERVVDTRGVTQVVLVEFPDDDATLRRFATFCEHRGLRFLVVSDLDSRFRHAVAVFEDQGVFFIGLREEPLESPLNCLLKRALDLAVAAPVVLLVLPLLTLAVWACQRLQSPGPLFFVQRRKGFRQADFDAYKFRTMHAKDASDEVRHVTTGDPRVFRAGHWFRRLNIDEFPQFINVLKGEMTLVGPRPHALKFDETYARVMANYYVRSAVKPGLTGLAQVTGFRGEVRCEHDIIGRVEADIRYLENWSIWLDCWIILRTAFQLFFPSPAAK